MAVTVLTGPSLASYINDRFRATWDVTPDPYPWLAGIMDQNVPSTRLIETYAAHDTPPYSRMKIDGQAITMSGFSAVSWTCENKDWEIGVGWRRKDREDDQLQGIVERAQQAGANWKVQNMRVAAQLILGAADTELLDALPNAPDGAALFATTAAGVDRFQVSGGNLLSTGFGFSSGFALRKIFYAARQQFRAFKNPRGKPRWTSAVMDKGFICIHSPALTEVINEAFLAGIVSGTAGGMGGGVTNTMHAVNYKLETQECEWLTGNTLIFGLKGAPVKPLFHQSRKAMWMEYADAANSDDARKYGDEASLFKSRDGYGVNTPDCIISIAS